MKLNAEQKRAARFDGGHALVLAGAGTGKTTTVMGCVEHLIRKGVEPERILLLTFTRRAAREMVTRLERRVGPASQRITAGTFHHFCLQTMRRMPKLFGLRRETVIDRDDQLQLMRLARVPFVNEGEQFPKAGQLVNLYSYARNTNRSAREHLQTYADLDEQTLENVLKVFKDYRQRKKACAYLDYDDILARFAKRLHEKEKCRRQLQRRFDHILVDEMQDTNPLQWLILDGLRDPAKLFCVGDDAQSIYAFRGADFRNVHAFTERVPGATVLKLEQNYRSTQEILDLSNWLLADSPLGYDKQLRAARGSGERPWLVECESEPDEATWIADDLIERHEDGAAWRDHMILTRTAWGAREVEATLVEREVPYQFIGGTSLLQSAHVKDVLALLRAVASPADELAWMRYLTLWPKIGDRTASKVIERLRGCADPEVAHDLVKTALPKQPKIARACQRVWDEWNEPQAAVATAAKALTPLLEQRYDHWDRRKRDLKLLERLAGSHRSVRAFIETYTLDPVSESVAQRTDEEDAVTLITVHSAKGTEAPVCYVIQVQSGNYPHIRSIGEEDQEEEERRVLYVALTRAQDELILTRTARKDDAFVPHGACDARTAIGKACFLDDVPEELLEWYTDQLVDDEDEEEAIRRYR
ncbi:MAG: ATP-dependent helicase [bacterium]